MALLLLANQKSVLVLMPLIMLYLTVISPKDPEFHLHVGGLLNPIPGSATTLLSLLRYL